MRSLVGVLRLSLEWVSVFLVGVGLGLSVAILLMLWRVWGNTHRAELDGRERLEILREQQERLANLREERRVLLDELERLREQKERLQWLREGRAALLAELKRLRSLVDEETGRTDARPLVPAEVQPPGDTAAGNQRNGHAAGNRGEFLESSGSRTVASRNGLLPLLVTIAAMWRDYWSR